MRLDTAQCRSMLYLAKRELANLDVGKTSLALAKARPVQHNEDGFKVGPSKKKNNILGSAIGQRMAQDPGSHFKQKRKTLVCSRCAV